MYFCTSIGLICLHHLFEMNGLFYQSLGRYVLSIYEHQAEHCFHWLRKVQIHCGLWGRLIARNCWIGTYPYFCFNLYGLLRLKLQCSALPLPASGLRTNMLLYHLECHSAMVYPFHRLLVIGLIDDFARYAVVLKLPHNLLLNSNFC